MRIGEFVIDLWHPSMDRTLFYSLLVPSHSRRTTLLTMSQVLQLNLGRGAQVSVNDSCHQPIRDGSLRRYT